MAMSQGLTKNEQKILKKKPLKIKFILFHLIIKLHLQLQVATIKKASCARLRVWRYFGLRSCRCGNSKKVASHALVICHACTQCRIAIIALAVHAAIYVKHGGHTWGQVKKSRSSWSKLWSHKMLQMLQIKAFKMVTR